MGVGLGIIWTPRRKLTLIQDWPIYFCILMQELILWNSCWKPWKRLVFQPLKFIHWGALPDIASEIKRVQKIEKSNEFFTNFILFICCKNDAEIRAEWQRIKSRKDPMIALNPVIQRSLPRLPFIPLNPEPKLGFTNPAITLKSQRLLARFRTPVRKSALKPADCNQVEQYLQALFLIEMASPKTYCYKELTGNEYRNGSPAPTRLPVPVCDWIRRWRNCCRATPATGCSNGSRRGNCGWMGRSAGPAIRWSAAKWSVANGCWRLKPRPSPRIFRWFSVTKTLICW